MSGLISFLTVLSAAALILILFWFVRQWAHNNKQPQVPMPAKVVSKLTLTHHHELGEGHSSEVTTHHLTFALSDEKEMDAIVAPSLYEEVSEGDSGTLFMQGTRFTDFVADDAE